MRIWFMVFSLWSRLRRRAVAVEGEVVEMAARKEEVVEMLVQEGQPEVGPFLVPKRLKKGKHVKRKRLNLGLAQLNRRRHLGEHLSWMGIRREAGQAQVVLAMERVRGPVAEVRVALLRVSRSAGYEKDAELFRARWTYG
jgi:hypothetical protein